MLVNPFDVFALAVFAIYIGVGLVFAAKSSTSEIESDPARVAMAWFITFLWPVWVILRDVGILP